MEGEERVEEGGQSDVIFVTTNGAHQDLTKQIWNYRAYPKQIEIEGVNQKKKNL